MIRSFYYFLIIIMAMMRSDLIFAQASVSDASVIVSNYPLQLQKIRDLNFGSITPSSTANGTVALSTNGQVSVTGGVAVLNNIGVSSAAYYVYGVPYAGYTVVLPSSVTLNGQNRSIIMRNLVYYSSGAGRIGSQGSSDFSIGATIDIPAGLLPGIYAGSFLVTVNYN